MVLRGVAVACLAIVAIASCSDDGDSSDTTPETVLPPRLDDGGADDGAVEASSPDAATGNCSPEAPFTKVLAVTELNTDIYNDEWPHLSPDELTIVFGSNRENMGDTDLFMSTRANRGAPFSKPAKLALSEPGVFDGDPMMSTDGLSLYFTSRRAGGNFGTVQNDLWRATRTNTTDPFAFPVNLDINSFANDQQPFLSPSGVELYFASDRADAGDLDLYIVNLSGGAPVHIDELSGPTTDARPTLSSDGLTLYFSSTRGGTGIKGNYDIWRSSRTSLKATWESPVPVAELNTTSEDHPGWLSPDGCRLWFHSNRTGTDDVYVAERSP